MSATYRSWLAGFLVLTAEISVPAVEIPDVEPIALSPFAQLEGPPGSREVSGVVASRQWPGVLWAINDSGDEPRIYPLDRQGHLQKSARQEDAAGVLIGGAANSDWEAIAVDASGHVIIGDMGNNSNARRDLALHYILEPEPTAGYTTLLKTIFVRYPEQKSWPAQKDDFNYDCEGIFTKDDTVYFVTKRRSDSLTRLYRLDSPEQGKVNQLTAIGEFDIGGRATGADASVNGRRLVVLTYDAVWMYEAATPGGDDWFAGAVWCLPYTGVTDAEGICFDGSDRLVIAAEEGAGKFYELQVEQLLRVR